MKMSEALEMFVQEKKSEGVSDKTVSHYYQDIKYFIQFTHDSHIDNITTEDVIRYRTYLLSKVKNDNHDFKPSGGTLSKVTINTYLRTLRTFLRYLESYDLIKPVKIKLLKEPKRIIKILDDDQIKQIMDLPENGWVQQRNKLIIYMMLDSGLRLQEVINLEISSVSIVFDRIYIINSKGEKDRIVPLGRISKRLFMKYLKSRPAASCPYLFMTIKHNQITQSAIKMILFRIKQKLAFQIFAPHYLRHTFATKFVINQITCTGVADLEQLSYILGHESTKVTRTYLHLANQYLIKTHQYGILLNVSKKYNINTDLL